MEHTSHQQVIIFGLPPSRTNSGRVCCGSIRNLPGAVKCPRASTSNPLTRGSCSTFRVGASPSSTMRACSAVSRTGASPLPTTSLPRTVSLFGGVAAGRVIAARTSKHRQTLIPSLYRVGQTERLLSSVNLGSPRRFARHRPRNGHADSSLRGSLPGHTHRRREKAQAAAHWFPAPLWRLACVLRPQTREHYRDRHRSPPPRSLPLRLQRSLPDSAKSSARSWPACARSNLIGFRRWRYSPKPSLLPQDEVHQHQSRVRRRPKPGRPPCDAVNAVVRNRPQEPGRVVAEAVRRNVNQDVQQPAEHLEHDPARQDGDCAEHQQENDQAVPCRIKRQADVYVRQEMAISRSCIGSARKPEPQTGGNCRPERQHIGERRPPDCPANVNAGFGRSLRRDCRRGRPQTVRNDLHMPDFVLGTYPS